MRHTITVRATGNGLFSVIVRMTRNGHTTVRRYGRQTELLLRGMLEGFRLNTARLLFAASDNGSVKVTF